jgi:sugar O-acyltransferase (sialic acid O-acetyltransferase NeuD family)
VEVAETCARLGWRIVTIVKNQNGPDYTSEPTLVVNAKDRPPLNHPVMLPLFRPSNRRTALEQARALGARTFAIAVDPTTVIPRTIEIGDGSYINAGCTVGSHTRFGRFVVVNRSVSIGHHVSIGDFASIGPGAVLAGQVEVGQDVFIGAGAIVLPKIRIGPGALIPAGAVVVKDVCAGNTAPLSRLNRS